MRASSSRAELGADMGSTGKKTALVDADVAGAPSIADITDSYLYLLGRLLVLQQEHVDFRALGLKWNTVIHRPLGPDGSANPNLDLATSDAWIAVDDRSCTVIDVPTITGRYYTIQILDMWGETVANINERTYPTHPAGSFLVCPKGARVTLPSGSTTERIDLPGNKARVHAHIALGHDATEAVALQQRIRVRATGTPHIAAPVAIPSFTSGSLPGVEAFETAMDVLATEPDTHPAAEILRGKVRTVAAAASASEAERQRIDAVIRQRAISALRRHVSGMGLMGNGWVRRRHAGTYHDAWHMRTVANLTDMWANHHTELASFENGMTQPLNGRHTYTMRFSKDDFPDSHVKYFWSLTCVDGTNLRVVANAQKRCVLNSHSRLEPASDGSLTLYLAPHKPSHAPEPNWLPTPIGQSYVLTWRSYGPDPATLSGRWFPPAITRGFAHRSRKKDADDPDGE
ncbi:MAG TPA: DUF1214 domain-containing protein [Vicinamibacterales bacterium]